MPGASVSYGVENSLDAARTSAYATNATTLFRRAMASEQRVNLCISGWIFDLARSRARVEQLLNDLQMIRPRLMKRRPDCRSQDCASIHAPRLERSISPEEQPYAFK